MCTRRFARLYAKGEPADAVTVAAELNRLGVADKVGGNAALVKLQTGTPASANAAKYANIVHEAATLRKLIEVGGEISELGYDGADDVVKTVDTAEAMVYRLAADRMGDTTARISELLPANLERIEMLYDQGEIVTGTPTGYNDLDEITSGLQPNTLVVIGARPSVGKTSFALGMAAHAAMRDNKPVLIFSLEMSQLEISQRILCSEARVDASRVRTGKLTDQDWADPSTAIGRLSEAPIWVGRQPGGDHHGDQGQVPPAAQPDRRVGHGDRRLPPAHDRAPLRREPPSGGVRDLPGPQDPVSGAGMPGGGALPALPQPGAAPGQAARTGRPAGVGLHRAGRRHRDLLVPRRDLHPETQDAGTAEVLVAKHRTGPTGKSRLAFIKHHTRFANMARGA